MVGVTGVNNRLIALNSRRIGAQEIAEAATIGSMARQSISHDSPPGLFRNRRMLLLATLSERIQKAQR
jgi:hypothetical protein